jgi:hypothetical protein
MLSQVYKCVYIPRAEMSRETAADVNTVVEIEDNRDGKHIS